MDRAESAGGLKATTTAHPLLLVRHSVPLVSDDVDYRPWPLSDEGKLLTARAADYLAGFKPVRLVASDERKAVQTARIIAKRVGVRVELEPGLREHDRIGVPWQRSEQRTRELQDFFANPTERVFGNETAVGTLDRFDAALRQSREELTGPVVIVTHGTVMSLYLARLTGQDAMDIWSKLGIPSVAVVNEAVPSLVSLVGDFDSEVLAPPP